MFRWFYDCNDWPKYLVAKMSAAKMLVPILQIDRNLHCYLENNAELNNGRRDVFVKEATNLV